MAMLEEGLKAYLATVSGLTTLVSTRVYPVVLPEAPTYPSVTYEKVSGARIDDHDGADLTPARMRLHAWSPDYKAAKLVAKQLIGALKGYSGSMGAVTAVTVVEVNEYDLYDDDERLHHIVVEATIWSTEPAS